LPLHLSDYYLSVSAPSELPFSSYYSDCLLRLPFFVDLALNEQTKIISGIYEFYADLDKKPDL
jgi:dTDP-4-amino-4,6-dideoxygalactose transaminase